MTATIRLRRLQRPPRFLISMSMLLILGGCGSMPPVGDPTAYSPLTNNDAQPRTIVLDWTGGETSITTGVLAPADLAAMQLPNGSSLDESGSAAFEEAVRSRVQAILGTLRPVQFSVVNGEADDYPDETVVFLTADVVPGDGLQVGQAKLDQCDLSRSGSVIVWIGTLLKVGNGFEYPQWVNALANVASHEVGHTLGFAHPETIYSDLTEYETTHDVMVGTHKLAALVTEQEFLVPQETCPDPMAMASGGVAYGVSTEAQSTLPTLARDLRVRGMDPRLACWTLEK